MARILYQTIEDRNNPDEVELHGPYLCAKRHAWFGPGYYFWDTIIDLAHWWGGLCYERNGYIICKSSCDEDMSEVYDLVGRPELLQELETITNIVMQKRNVKKVFVPEVMEYMKKETSFLKRYKAVRANPLLTLPLGWSRKFWFKFNDRNRAYIDTRPAIQFCFFDTSLLTGGYRIVFPEEYCVDDNSVV